MTSLIDPITQQASTSTRIPVLIDLHLDSFIWTRIFGYDISKRHGLGALNGYFLSQVDLPRLKDAGVTGAMWSITTNPFRTSAGRAKAFQKNVDQFLKIIEENAQEVSLISSSADLNPSILKNRHAVWLSIQGGNALDQDLGLIDRFAGKLTRVTLMHLTHSRLGTSSMPQPTFRKRGLSQLGHEYVKRLNENKIFVDLAHADVATFQDVVKIHDRALPILVTHTGVKGVHDHWRNLSDDQIKAIANTGGVIGILYHEQYLGKTGSADPTEIVLKHLEHIHKVAGEDFTALGSDWDGMIVPVKGLRNCVELPELVKLMFKRGWNTSRIEKTLGLNFLNAFARMRPA